jgi:hypothetical protein
VDGESNVVTLKNPVKKSEEVSTVELRFKALRLTGVQGLVCDKEQVQGSLCVRLVKDRIAISVFGNHITSSDPVISGDTQIFDYRFKPFTGYHVSVVYGLLPKGMAYAKLYVNGKVASTKFFSSGYQAHLGTTYVAGLQSNTHGYFQGFIDELRIWNVPRMAWQIQKTWEHELVGVEHGLVAYFPFDVPGLHGTSLGVSHWNMVVDGAMYTEPFAIGRRN